MAIELDNYDGKRVMRLEYKRPGQGLADGQLKHALAELECVKSDWCKVFILVIDNGQTKAADMVQWGARASHIVVPSHWRAPDMNQYTTVAYLGDWIVRWLWPERKRSLF